MWILRAILLILLAALGTSAAVAEPSARVIDTSPVAGTQLAGHEPLYLRVAWSDTGEGWINVELFRGERKVSDRNGGMIRMAGSSGEGLTWVSQPAGGAIDRIRLIIRDADGKVTREVDQPLAAQWTGAGRSEQAAWVAPLQARSSEALAQAPSNEPSGVMSFLVGIGMFAMAILYLVLQAVLPRRWQGGWRIAALVPLIGLVAAFGWSLLALADGSNLWPLMLIFYLPLGFLFMGLLVVLKTLAGGR